MGTVSETMERVKTAADLQAYCDDTGLERRGRDSYVCPICNSGNGPSHSAAFHVQGKRWKCFSCGHSGDVFDLAGILHQTEDRAEQLRIVAEWAGITLEGGREGANKATETKNRPTGHKTAESPKFEPTIADTHKYDEGRARHRAYIKTAQANIAAPEAVAYLEGRGIDLDTARAWGLGYDPRARRIVIPWPGEDPYSHIDRSIDQAEGSGKYRKPKSDEVGPQPMWGAGAMREGVYYVVEGALDALEVTACGVPAVAVCGASSRDVVDAAISQDGIPVVMMDFDEDESKGPAHQADMCAALAAAGHDYESAPADTLLGCKDAAEAWATDREALAESLGSLQARAIEGREARKAERYAAALGRLNVCDPMGVTAQIYAGEVTTERIGTGIPGLDTALAGGFPSRGLVVYGAVSSAGKTTMMVQMCDHWAESGRPVLFVTIEQSAAEIVAKSLSRLVGLTARASGGYMRASADAIMSREERQRWAERDPEKLQALCAACERYQRIAYDERGRQRLYIMEGSGRPSVDDIRAVAERIAEHDGRPPIIAIDYLQLLGPCAGHERDQERLIVNDNITALRQMAGKISGTGTLVVLISALNRASYGGSIDMESFRESSGIEYGADMILGIQPAKFEGELEDEANEAKAKAKAKKMWRHFKKSEIKDCEIVTLKNRNGRIPEAVRVRFEAVSSLYAAPSEARNVAWS